MKKLFSLVVVSFFAVSVYASDVNVSVSAKAYNTKDFNETAGLSVKAVFPKTFAENVEASVALELVEVESELTGKESDFVIVPVELGYVYKIDEVFSVKSLVGVDLISGDDVDTTVGSHVGAELSVNTPIQGLSGVVGLGYQFANVDVNDVKHDFSGYTGSAGLNYKW